MRFHQIWSKSRLIYVKYSLNLGFLAEIWVFSTRFWNFSHRNLGFSPEFGFFSGRFGFWGIETETDPPESISGGRTPTTDHRNSRVDRFRIGSSQVIRVGQVSDGFGQAYLLCFFAFFYTFVISILILSCQSTISPLFIIHLKFWAWFSTINTSKEPKRRFGPFSHFRLLSQKHPRQQFVVKMLPKYCRYRTSL